MKVASVALILVCGVVMCPRALRATDIACRLEPVAVLAHADFAGEPVAITTWQDRILLLDPLEQVIWRLDPATGECGLLELPSHTANDMFFGCDDRLYVVDPGERALFVHAPESGAWRRIDLGYRVFYGAGSAEMILFNADRRRQQHLVTACTCAGDTLRLGRRLTHAHPYAAVANNMNYARLALAPDVIVVGHIALGHLQVYSRDGARLSAFSLAGPEVAAMRGVYLASLGVAAAGTLSVSPDTLIADLVRAAQPERFAVPVYVAGLAVHAGLVFVLVNNTLQIFTPRGELVARHAIAGQQRGERVVIHAFCITPQGRLLGLDAVHYRKIYDFGPAARLAAGCIPVGNEEGTASGKEPRQ